MAVLQTFPQDELYNYTFMLPLEDQYAAIPSMLWMQANWHHSLTLSLIYVLFISIGQKLMAKRPAFDLEQPMFLWNAGLAIFSIMGAIRMSPEFYHVLFNQGFQYSICTAGYAHISVTGFWLKLFVFSKAAELIDTVFIVLRKRPLNFLHWYHHATVLVYCWHAFKDHTAAGRWFIFMNYHVHAIMYTYYALRSRGWRFPKWFPMSITCMQIAQMVVGCFIAIRVFIAKCHGQFCQQTDSNLWFAFAIYLSYFLLFANFFYQAYFRQKRYDKPKKVQEHEKNGKIIEITQDQEKEAKKVQ